MFMLYMRVVRGTESSKYQAALDFGLPVGKKGTVGEDYLNKLVRNMGPIMSVFWAPRYLYVPSAFESV